MGFIDKVKNIVFGSIEVKEPASQEWIPCPKCHTNVEEIDLNDNGGVCPFCGYTIR